MEGVEIMRELLLRIAKMLGPMLLICVKMIGLMVVFIAVDLIVLIYDAALNNDSTFTERMTLFVVMMIFFREPK